MQILFVSEPGFIECEPLRESFLHSFLQRPLSNQDLLYHKEIQAACNIRADMGMGKTADRVYNVDRITIRVYSTGFHNTAVDAGRQDPHKASVAVIPFLAAAAFLCISVPAVTVDRLHRAAADIVGLPVRSKISVV